MEKEEKDDLIARISWLYYVAGKTQLEIAKLFNLSRQIIQRLLAQGNKQGMVNVSINHSIIQCLEIAQKLAQKYTLEFCQVAPTGNLVGDEMTKILCLESAKVMEKYIRHELPLTIGIGSGKTLKETISYLPVLEKKSHSVVSLISSFTVNGLATRYDVPLKLAEKLQCDYYIIPAPLYTEDEQEKALWCKHKTYQSVYQRALSADVIFAGIGDVSLNCPLHREGFISDQQIRHIIQQGGIADLLGFFVSATGQFQQNTLENIATSVKLNASLNKNVIAFAGGEPKFEAIRAVLTGKLVKGLVIDEKTAKKLLA